MSISEVKSIVKKECMKKHPDYWDKHIKIVLKNAINLAKFYPKADKEVVQLGALLHDYTKVKIGTKKHWITGAREAEKILKKLKYNKKTIEDVKSIIITHGAVEEKPKSIEGKILCAADAMASFDYIEGYFKHAFLGKKIKTAEEVIEYVKERIEFGWKNKMLVPEAKELAKDKYKAFKTLFS